jgi:hypothetical protein
MGNADTASATRNNRTICLPFSQEDYEANIKNPADFRSLKHKTPIDLTLSGAQPFAPRTDIGCRAGWVRKP